MQINKSILLFVLLWGGETYALTYQWPVITATKIEYSAGNPMRIEMTLKGQTINDPYITSASTVGEVLSRHGVVLGTSITANTFYRTDSTYNINGALYPGAVTPEHKWTFLIDEVRKVINTTFTARYLGASANTCVGTGVITYNATNIPAAVFQSHYYDPTNSPCFVVPPSEQWCALTDPTIIFSYGALTLANASNATQTNYGNVECTSGMKYVLRLFGGQKTIALSNGMEARIQAGGLILAQH